MQSSFSKFRWRAIGGFTCSALVAFLSLGATSALALDQGAQAPSFTLRSLSGEEVSSSSLAGQVVYVDFWASWCGPCKHTLPWMSEIQKKFSAQGLKVVAINLDTDPAAAQKALKDIDVAYQVLLDPEKKAVSLFEPPKMPSSFLIDRHGKIRLVHGGFRAGDEAALEEEIARLVKES